MPWVKKIKVNRHECYTPGVWGRYSSPGIRTPKYEKGSQWDCRKCGQRWELTHSQVTWTEAVTPGLKEVPRAHTPWYRNRDTWVIFGMYVLGFSAIIAANVSSGNW